jgi:hypothetical protein
MEDKNHDYGEAYAKCVSSLTDLITKTTSRQTNWRQ